MSIALENKLKVKYGLNKLELCAIVNDRKLKLLETEAIFIKKEKLFYFSKLTNDNNEVVEFTVLLSIYNILLQRYFESVQFIASSGLVKNEEILLYDFQYAKGASFKECLSKVKKEIQTKKDA